MEIDENRPIGIISDVQEPYGAHRAIDFCKYVARHHNIPPQNWYNVGDETDSFWGSLYPKSPEALHTIKGERESCLIRMNEWYQAFPQMRVAISNHGLRWARKAAAAEIPAEFLRSYEELIQAPKTWRWQYEWIVPTKHPFKIIHGMEYSGANATRQMVFDYGMSVAHGHLHSNAQVVYIRTGRGHGLNAWGMNVGCLIDTEAYAFDYDKKNRMKPCLGIGVVFNKGSTPVWLPYE